MLGKRRIRQLVFTILVVGLVCPPSSVLCVEPTGEVRVEYTAVACCAAGTGTLEALAVVTDNDNDCDGCRDVALSLTALRSTRAQADRAATATTPSTGHAPLHLILQAPLHAFRAAQPPLDPALAVLTSTVIRR